MPTIKDLKLTLAKNNARWLPHPRLLDLQDIPTFRTGGLEVDLLRPDKVHAIDFTKLFSEPPTNPYILERRIAHRIVAPTLLKKELQIGSLPEALPGEGGEPIGGTAPQMECGR